MSSASSPCADGGAPSTPVHPRIELEAIIARHCMQNKGSATPVPGLKVGRIVQPISPCIRMAEACVCILIRGARSLAAGNALFPHDEQTYLLSSVGLPASVEIAVASPADPYTALRIDLDLDLARQVMADIEAQAPDAALAESPLSLGRIDPGLFDAILRLVRLIETPKDVAFMSGLLHREILYRLLTSPAGGKLRLMARLGTQGNRAARVVRWLRSHFREPLRIGHLADIAGMAPSTLHRHFHELTGMSPIQYQKRLRLHQARHLMLEEGLDVGSTALAVGYESSTQFIREYRRLFGAPPLRDVKALRARGHVQHIS